MKLFDFVLARNGVVELTPIEQPTREFDSFGEVFERGAAAGECGHRADQRALRAVLQEPRRSPK